ncbi:MAG: ABC transporter permease [Actinomycetota bacterium]|nr:ABC transporter permease [Actinomycetota bacterium]
MSGPSGSLILRVVPPAVLGTGRARHLIERNLMVQRRHWLVVVSGLFEPAFYLLSIGIGIGKLVGRLPGPHGTSIGYAAYVAPAMLASSAMNGGIYESTFNVFFKLKYAKVYDAVLATPLGPGDVAVGEIGYALMRGTLYGSVFLVMMTALGDVESSWAVLALPAVMLISFAFAAAGMAFTTFMRGWTDFDMVQLAVLPLFLFSATFYPLGTYPRWLQLLVQGTPLFHGVVLVRGLTTGAVGWALCGHAAYLMAMGLIGLTIAGRRVRRLLLS